MDGKIKFYIALDVHDKVTQYAVRTWQGDITLEGQCSTTYRDVKQRIETYSHSCIVGMEASTCFYPLYHGFLQDGIPVKVANVLRIRQLIVKTDKLDAQRLSDMLRLGSFPESFIPPQEIQTLRNLVSLRHSFLQELTSLQSRIWATLHREGVRIPTRSIFSKKGLSHIIQLLKEERGGVQLPFLYSQYKNTKEELEHITKKTIAYAQQDFLQEWQKLQEIDGIGPLMASYIIAEVCPISRFASEKKLRRYAGVIPCIKESAGKSYGNRLPKSSSRALLRWALVQAVHGAIRTKGSTLHQYYQQRKVGHKSKSKMAVARALCDIVYKKLQSQSL